MSTVTMPHSKQEVALDLVRAHFAIEPGLRRAFRVLSPSEQDEDFTEPVKLLEVNEDTLEAGISPVHFGAHVDGERWYPPVIVMEVTPAEFEKIKKGTLPLPNGWQLGQELTAA